MDENPRPAAIPALSKITFLADGTHSAVRNNRGSRASGYDGPGRLPDLGRRRIKCLIARSVLNDRSSLGAPSGHGIVSRNQILLRYRLAATQDQNEEKDDPEHLRCFLLPS